MTRVTALMAMILLAVAPSFAGAGDKDGERRGRSDNRGGNVASVSGVISDVNGTTIKILNGQVTIDATNATIVGEEKRGMLTAAMLTVGRVIEVYGTPGMAPGTITARIIQVYGLKADGRIRGAITAVDAANNTITVLGTTITINAATVFEGRRGLKPGPADLVVGAAVEVSVAVLQNTLVALEIEINGGYAARR
ncbi:MAG: DUF5666 domain-containing protein [Blastocatellia bacterium]|nr:DUF5666 domain-containing protein [Blastocatellia bacterium]